MLSRGKALWSWGKGAAGTSRWLVLSGVLAGAVVWQAPNTTSAQLHGAALYTLDCCSDAGVGVATPSAIVHRVEGTAQFFVDDVIGKPGSAAPITIEVPPFSDADRMVLSIKGMPAQFSLTSGFRTTEGWLVSTRDLGGLRLVAPQDFTGSFELEFHLLRDNVEPVVRKVWVDIQPVPLRAASTPASQVQQPQVQVAEPVADREPAPFAEAASRPKKRISPAAEQGQLTRAEGLLKTNDIAAARLIYSMLARRGSSQGALLMGRTYDPAFLSHFNVEGLEPDLEQAKHWYGVASDLGSEDASGRLLALQSSPR